MRFLPALAMVLLFLAMPGSAVADARADFERAMRAVEGGDYSAAVKHFGNIIKSGELGPAGLAVVHVNRGHSFLQLELYDGALGDFTRALTLSPGHAGAHYGRGRALAAKGQDQAALADFDAAIANRPDFAEPHGERGQVLLRLGRLDEALVSLNEAIRLGVQDWRVSNNRGIILMTRGDLQGAFGAFDQAVGAGPDQGTPYRNRGILYMFAGTLPQAGFDLEQAVKLAPGDLDTILWRTIYNSVVALGVKSEIAGLTTPETRRAWPGPLLEMFLETDVPASVLATGEEQFARGPAQLLAQTRYAVAIYYLFNGNPNRARDLFERIVAMGVPNLFEHHGAVIMLERMGVVPATGKQ